MTYCTGTSGCVLCFWDGCGVEARKDPKGDFAHMVGVLAGTPEDLRDRVMQFLPGLEFFEAAHEPTNQQDRYSRILPLFDEYLPKIKHRVLLPKRKHNHHCGIVDAAVTRITYQNTRDRYLMNPL